MAPSFSPYPFARLRRLSRREAALESAIARWLDGRGPTYAKLVKLAQGPVAIRITGAAAIDPHAALAEIRANGLSLYAAAPARTVRMLAQLWLGGPDELDAPRPLAQAEHAIWCLVVAAAVADSGIDARVWPAFERTPASLVAEAATVVGHARALAPTLAAPAAGDDFAAIELAVVFGHIETTVAVLVPRALELRAPPPRALPAWSFDLPIVVGRAALPAATRLGIGDIVIVERVLELEVGDSRIGLTAAARAVEAKVATGYIPRDMALPDDAHLELTVQLGTTRLSLRALSELAVGAVISLGRPLAGPFDVRAGGRLVGQGELVDIDGELGVRIVSVAQE